MRFLLYRRDHVKTSINNFIICTGRHPIRCLPLGSNNISEVSRRPSAECANPRHANSISIQRHSLPILTQSWLVYPNHYGPVLFAESPTASFHRIRRTEQPSRLVCRSASEAAGWLFRHSSIRVEPTPAATYSRGPPDMTRAGRNTYEHTY